MQPTSRLRIEEAKYLQSQLGDPSRDAVRTQRALRALLSISTAISALRKEEEIFQRLDLITEAVLADQVARAHRPPESGAMRSAALRVTPRASGSRIWPPRLSGNRGEFATLVAPPNCHRGPSQAPVCAAYLPCKLLLRKPKAFIPGF